MAGFACRADDVKLVEQDQLHKFLGGRALYLIITPSMGRDIKAEKFAHFDVERLAQTRPTCTLNKRRKAPTDTFTPPSRSVSLTLNTRLKSKNDTAGKLHVGMLASQVDRCKHPEGITYSRTLTAHVDQQHSNSALFDGQQIFCQSWNDSQLLVCSGGSYVIMYSM